MELILASTSPYRRQLLERLGVPFRCVAPGVDEDAVRKPAWTPQDVALHLARLKTEAVAQRFPDAFVIGSDQVADLAGEVLGKRGHRAGAIDQLARLSGTVHTLWTAVAFGIAGDVTVKMNCTRLTMRSLTAAEIERYVDADQPWDCAGSYKLESRGIALFESIETEDATAIIGLPLIAVTTALRANGFCVP